MGFGSSVAKPISELRMPVHLSLALGVCAGLAAVAIGAGVWRLMTPATPVLRPVLPAPFQGVMLQDMRRSGAETYRLALGTPKMLRVETIPAHSVINVTWNWKEETTSNPSATASCGMRARCRRQYAVVNATGPDAVWWSSRPSQRRSGTAACHSVAGSRQR